MQRSNFKVYNEMKNNSQTYSKEANMSVFDGIGRVSMDECAIQARNLENESINNYFLFNYFHTDGCVETAKKNLEFSLQYPNLRFRDGYGVANSCTIETDMELRLNSKSTRPGEKQQLCSRNFIAVPDFSKGTCIPNLETMLIQGSDTSIYKNCHNLAEFETNKIQPLLPCIANHIKIQSKIIPEDPIIGRPSKELFLKNRQCNR